MTDSGREAIKPHPQAVWVLLMELKLKLTRTTKSLAEFLAQEFFSQYRYCYSREMYPNHFIKHYPLFLAYEC